MDASEFEGLKAEYVNNLPSVAGVLSGGLSARSAKVRQLLLATSTDAYELRSAVALYQSSEPLFVRLLRIYGPDADLICKSLELYVVRTDGKKVKAKRFVKSDGGNVHVFINALIDGFELIPIKKAVVGLTKIEVTGYTTGQIEAFGDQLRVALDQRVRLNEYLEGARVELHETSARKVALDGEISVLAEQRDGLTSAVAIQGRDLERLSLEVSQVSSNLELKISANRDAMGAKEQLDAELAKLNALMGETRFQLKELVESKRMISDEFSDFVLEGRGQARVYGWLSVVPAVAAAVVVGFLLKGAWNVTELIVTAPSQAYALFLQRLPYTAASVLVVTLLLKVVDALIKKVMAIHEDRLGLAKLLVIARDTVFASANGLKLSDDEVFEQRLRLKMELLKVHLGSEISPSFVESQEEDVTGGNTPEGG